MLLSEDKMEECGRQENIFGRISIFTLMLSERITLPGRMVYRSLIPSCLRFLSHPDLGFSSGQSQSWPVLKSLPCQCHGDRPGIPGKKWLQEPQGLTGKGGTSARGRTLCGCAGWGLGVQEAKIQWEEPVGAPGWGCRQAGSCRVGVSGDTRDGLEGGRLRITFLPVADDLHQAG